MKKDFVEIDGIRLPLVSVNTIVIGSGAAALNAAVSLYDRGQKDVAIVTDKWGGGTSNNAGSDKQTYYKLSLAGKIPDSAFDMAKDLFSGGCMHGDIALCEAQHSAQAFFHLAELGVPFPHDVYGAYIGYKTDHDQRGRGTSAGPLTSKMMFEALARDVKRKNIPVFDEHEIISLLKYEGDSSRQVIGAVALDRNDLEAENNGMIVFNTVNTIMATGGPAGIYKTSVYPVSQSGSHGLAFRIGAAGQNLTESQFGLASIKFRWNVSGTYQQVIPRYVSTDNDGNDEREFLKEFFPDTGTLASAVFLKGYQWPFDPRKVSGYGSSLIDVLVYRETAQKNRRVFLDFNRNPGSTEGQKAFNFDGLNKEAYEYLERSDALLDTPIERLRIMNQPAIDLYKRNGIDITQEYLEIAVCAQHNNGGLKGNIWWESNIKHLFPVGEVNGTHGVYRPGGASLNSGQTGSLRAAIYIAENYSELPPDEENFLALAGSQIKDLTAKTDSIIDENGSEDDRFMHLGKIRDRMTKYGSAIRNPEEIEKAVKEAREQFAGIENVRIRSRKNLPDVFKLQDLWLTHLMYLEAIGEYLKNGGKSRGSYIVLDRSGDKPCDTLEDSWKLRMTEDNSFTEDKILEIELNNDDLSINKKWVDVRPVPDEDLWFEKIWKDFREGKIIK
ncbi:MAG: FAD-binding protein [bacterium]|nr:FAD-binding protein [bacterium]